MIVQLPEKATFMLSNPRWEFARSKNIQGSGKLLPVGISEADVECDCGHHWHAHAVRDLKKGFIQSLIGGVVGICPKCNRYGRSDYPDKPEGK
jgi:hypothetical protein